MKKRKLNSKNPKYMSSSETKEKKVIKRVLINTTQGGHKIWVVWYEN